MSRRIKIGQSSAHSNRVSQRSIADGLSVLEDVDCTEKSAKNKSSKEHENKVQYSDKGDQGE